MKNQYEKTNGADWLLKEAIIYYTLKLLASHIIEYASDFTTFEQVNREFILGFIGYLKTAQNFNYKKKGEIVSLVPNTQHNLFIKFSYVIKKAF